MEKEIPFYSIAQSRLRNPARVFGGQKPLSQRTRRKCAENAEEIKRFTAKDAKEQREERSEEQEHLETTSRLVFWCRTGLWRSKALPPRTHRKNPENAEKSN
jgi:hypothetical protein